jgi:putative ABC transport system permease protein
MFKHNLILAFRNFKRYKSSFIINLIGLTSGLVCTLLIYLWVSDEMSTDRFHEKGAQLYQVMAHQQYTDHVRTVEGTPGPLAETLKEDFAEIEYAATTTWVEGFTLTHNDINVKAKGYHVGKDFFNIFSYGLVQGSADHVLGDKYSIVISESLAEKVFGTKENIVGKTITIQQKDNFTVTGVFMDVPKNSSYKFDFVLTIEFYQDKNSWLASWGANGPTTFVTLHEGTNPIILNSKIVNVVKNYQEGSNVSLFLEPYTNRYLYSRFKDRKPSGGRIEYVKLFTMIAAFILLIACINFMNLSTARASRRAKEVGLKKAIGANRGSLLAQYLGESLVVSLISMLVAIAIVYLFLPVFNDITYKEIQLQMNLEMLLAAITIIGVTGLIAGSYPALYLSSFNAVTVLKGEVKGTLGELWARRGLVVFQFTLSIILIVSILVIYMQIDFVKNKNLGYNNDNLIYFDAVGKVETNMDAFLSELKKIPHVSNASSVWHNLVDQGTNTSDLSWEGKNASDDILFELVIVNYDMLETMSVKLAEGRFFDRALHDDTTRVIFNEAAIKAMGLNNPLGKTVSLGGELDLEIVGVVKDFHFESMHSEISPLFFMIFPENKWNIPAKIMARIEVGKEKETIAAFAELHNKFNPGFTFDFKFLDERYAQLYSSETQVASLTKYFTIFAVLISCLGLFGLATFTAERRIKEIGIRKVMGSTATNIVYLLTKDFTKMVALAILIGIPVSYYIVDTWLQRFAYRIELQYWFFVASGVVALMVAWLTVGYQAVRSANSNPAECLRDE